MNQRSRRAWIENVAWTLVVSMSLLQLIGTSVSSQANAQSSGNSQCWTRKPDGPARFTDCGPCAAGGCTGFAFRAFAYDICAPATSGHKLCSLSTWRRVEVGKKKQCRVKYNMGKLVACAGSGAVAAVIAGCGIICAPTGPGWPACMSGCVATSPSWVPVVGGGIGGTFGCLNTCFAVDYCFTSDTSEVVWEDAVDLWLPGCSDGA